KTAIVWIPVAVLGRSSVERGAALLKQGMPGLRENEKHYNAVREAGGVQPLKDPGRIKKVIANTRFLARSGHSLATPTLVWKNARGVHLYPGAPPKTQFQHILQAFGGSHEN